MEDCIFCKIANGRVQSAKIYEDNKVISFLDILPANKGHCLVIPKKHYENLASADDEILAEIMRVIKKVVNAVSLSTGNEGYNIVQNNGKAAGQIVSHIHFHIIPRFEKDGLRIKWSHKKYTGNEINLLAEQIKKFI